MKHFLSLKNMAATAITMLATAASAATVVTPSENAVMLSQNADYTFTAADGYYVNPSFFSKNSDGSYKFKAISGTYQVYADATNQYLQIRPMVNGSFATLNNDGSGALWIIGTGIGLPSVAAKEVGWTTEYAVAMAQVAAKTYEITLTVGTEVSANIDFKFFGQANWGVEFTGSGTGDNTLTTDSELLSIGKGNAVNGHGDGNLFVSNGKTLDMGDVLTITIDCTGGAASPVMHTSLKKSSEAFAPMFNGIEMKQKNGYYTYSGTLTKGAVYSVSGAPQFEAETFFFDPDFFTKNSDGTLTFIAATGTYDVAANFDRNYFMIYPTDGGQPANYTKGGIYAIGSTGYGKPSYSNSQNWWTDLTYCHALAQVEENVFRITLVGGQQIKTSGDDVNFKFFGQAGWGHEFTNGQESSEKHKVTFTDNTGGLFVMEGGNITIAEDKTLEEGETYIFTLDLTDGIDTGKVTVDTDHTNGINSAKNQPVTATTIYTLQGIRLSATSTRGIYISNGKKFVVK